MKVVIAEKPSVAREIAVVLGATSKKDGYIEGKGYAVTWAFGHLVVPAMPEQYGIQGFKQENLPILPSPFQLIPRQIKESKEYKPDPGVFKQLNVIKELFSHADEIIVATDAGREGELIFRQIYDYLKCTKPFRRLWISSLTDRAIKEGLNDLKKGSDFDNLYYAARSRSEADWLVGINASQALSIAAGSGIYSLGRVQTPTLAMVCSRYLEHINFVSTPYWQIQTEQESDRTTFKMLSEVKFTDKAEAQEILNRSRHKKMEIIDVETKNVHEEPPLLYDLTALQKDANIQFNLTAGETLEIAQSLYEKKFITYPRTGSRYIGEDVWEEIPVLLEVLLAYPHLKEYAKALKMSNLNKKSVNNLKVTDHHALLITDNTASGLSVREDTVYNMIASRMLESLSDVCEKEVIHITGIVSGQKFRAHGTDIVKAGWRAVRGFFDSDKPEESVQSLPYLEKGDKLEIESVPLLEKKTKSKPLFTEATLLSAMERAGKEIENEEERNAIKESGIGTPATRATIIETLFARDYMKRQKKSLVPTPKGLKVYEVVKDKRIADVSMTGMWENALSKIESGEMPAYTFNKSIAVYTSQITGELLSLDFPQEKVEVFDCPKCKQHSVKLFDKIAKCTDEQCDFLLFRNFCGKTLSENDVKVILSKGKSPLIEGMKSRAKKKFDAYIVLKEDGSAAFEFPKTIKGKK
ncbi:type IA DNA topoisomerase [Proteiniphilum sp. UBA5346]|uniref:type IA DNA topoisomerase n=1 Tax=Proteiniphilum sp. UBA5346 TaxID=1947277 RepID=UPI00257E7159|nr:type IA DNA topoisomerase [Proteiniphilum sp. UBA5346]